MTKGNNFFRKSLLVGFLLFSVWYLFVGNPFWKQTWFTGENQNHSSDSSMTYVDMTIDELESWRATQFNVDVKVTSSHAWLEHSTDATDALKCANRNGTFGAISEKETRRLHLFCKDENGNVYVIIIRMIKRAIDSYSNATSELVTAFKLNGTQTIEMYITNETVTKGFAIVVKLWFSAGELFFSP